MRHTRFFLFIVGFFALVPTNAQKTSQSVFVEVGGAGLPFSFNYDTRFHKGTNTGIGGRIGLGGFAVEDEKMFTIPAQVNWLFGKDKSFFELGIGATFVHYEGYEYYENYTCINSNCYGTGKRYAGDFLLPIGNVNSVMGTMTFGYRRVPINSGFMWKAAITPVFNENGFWPLWAGVGVGYKF